MTTQGKTTKCGVLGCGLPPETRGIAPEDIGKAASEAKWRGINPVSGCRFLCCDECKNDFQDMPLDWEKLT